MSKVTKVLPDCDDLTLGARIDRTMDGVPGPSVASRVNFCSSLLYRLALWNAALLVSRPGYWFVTRIVFPVCVF